MVGPTEIIVAAGIFLFFWFCIKRMGIRRFVLRFALILFFILLLLGCFIFVELSLEKRDAHKMAENIGYSPVSEDISFWFPFEGIRRFIFQKLYVGMSRDQVHDVMKGYYKMHSGRSGDHYFESYYFKLGLLRRPCIEILYTKDFRVIMYELL